MEDLEGILFSTKEREPEQVYPQLYADRANTAYHLALFPNTFFSLYPDALFRVVLSPKSRKHLERSVGC